MTYDNYPREDLVKGAEKLLAEAAAQGRRISVFFKATCPKCGERPAFAEPNTMYETMECCECGHVFPFVSGNYFTMEDLT